MAVEKRDVNKYRWSEEFTAWVPDGVKKTTDIVLSQPTVVNGVPFPWWDISDELIVKDEQFVGFQIDCAPLVVTASHGTIFRIEVSTEETGTDAWSTAVEFITQTSSVAAVASMVMVAGTNAYPFTPIPAGWSIDDYTLFYTSDITNSEFHRIGYAVPGTIDYVYFVDNTEKSAANVLIFNKAERFQYRLDARPYSRCRAVCYNSSSDPSNPEIPIIWRCLATVGL
jgi:hypothetical protein